MATGEPDDSEVYDAVAVSWIAASRHTVPCRIVAFDLETQTATVESTYEFKRLNPTTGAVEFFGTIKANGVPIAYYGTGSWSLTGPIHVGDAGICHVSDRCLAQWKASDQDTVADKTSRMWDFNDAIFFPFHCRPSRPLPTNNSGPRGAVDAANNEQVCLRVGDDQGISLGSLDVNSLIALADLVLDRLNQIKADYNSHTHAGSFPVTGGGGGTASGTTSGPTPTVGTIASVASDRVSSE